MRKLFAAIPAAAAILILATGCSDKGEESKPPEITTSPASIYREVAVGFNPPDVTVGIFNAGDGTMTYSTNTSADWISIFGVSGRVPDSFIVDIGVGSLDAGTHIDTIWINSSEAANSPYPLEVVLTLENLFELSPPSLSFAALSGDTAPPPKPLIVDAVSPTSMQYTLTSGSDWLTITPSQGTSPDTVEVSVDPAISGSGIFVDTIIATSPSAGAPGMVICSLTVSNWGTYQLPDPRDLRALSFVDAQHGWSVGVSESFGGGGIIYRTIDGGASWVLQRPDIRAALGDVQFMDLDTGWATGADGLIMQTADGGDTWKEPTLPPDVPDTFNVDALSFVSVNVGWAVGSKGVILHTANGVTWERQYSGYSDDFRQVCFVSADSGWVVGNAGRVLFTGDGGQSWQLQPWGGNADLWDVYFADNLNGWVVGEVGRILHTVDGGQTWTQLPRRTQSVLDGLTFAAGGQGWAVGEKGTILYTADGVNWIVQSSGTLERLQDVAFVNDSKGFIVGSAGVILFTNTAGF